MMNKKQLVQNLEQVLQQIQRAHKDAKTHKNLNPGDMRASRIEDAVNKAGESLTGVIETVKNEVELEGEPTKGGLMNSFNNKSFNKINEKASEEMDKVMTDSYEDKEEGVVEESDREIEEYVNEKFDDGSVEKLSDDDKDSEENGNPDFLPPEVDAGAGEVIEEE